jgi:hypothetical protein
MSSSILSSKWIIILQIVIFYKKYVHNLSSVYYGKQELILRLNHTILIIVKLKIDY